MTTSEASAIRAVTVAVRIGSTRVVTDAANYLERHEEDTAT